ncbi:hypothetical protein [Methylophilus sp. QUAN]|nr:hypothetical protein [Methylophilus sp. QUAN]MBF4990967.1 hypothetical protein [Methylophilus sp. QUAN]
MVALAHLEEVQFQLQVFLQHVALLLKLVQPVLIRANNLIANPVAG